MSDKYIVEPDLEFIDNIVKLGGDSVKKCFQCATCSVACPIAPEESPFPRKEMIATSWGLKDKVVKSCDIWLCHECGDCSELCPRGAYPGDVLSAARSIAIEEYATPKFFSKMVNDPKQVFLIFGIPAVWFAILAYITVFGRGMMEGIFNSFGMEFFNWSHDVPIDKLTHSNFVSTWFIDLTFVPLATVVALIFFKSLNNFVKDIHQNAVSEGKTKVTSVSLFGLLPSVIGVLSEIISHRKFKECSENKERANAHMMVLYGFIGCFITTITCVILLYLFHMPGPYTQIMPHKILANIGGIAIVIGVFLMIKKRLSSEEAKSTYKDWFLLILVFGVGLTGILTQFLRLIDARSLTYFTYYLHLIFIFNLFAFLPFSKLAHIVYRTFALAYFKYSGRK